MKLGNSSRAMGVGAYFLKVFFLGGLRGAKLQSENVSEPSGETEWVNDC